ncbi:rab-GTPase-TBC domain-containing protein [Amylocarpus encephaloides]|uniref:Rab-GTPase-TBC domain-containing protein n=1 Tax=Amylocarpus encephaloides TaxID=45428 RepID=A0A9P7YIZ9_9HELO|nr:rab-GTPase-TBC domain-containing protein [Amylocarpus encephaloides]
MAPERAVSLLHPLLRSFSSRSPPRPPPNPDPHHRRSSPTQVSQPTRASDGSDGGLVALRYEETVPAKPPIAVTVTPSHRAPPLDSHPALRNTRWRTEEDDKKRDSGLAPTTSSRAREGSVNTVEENVLGISIDFNSPPQTKMAQPVADLTISPVSPIATTPTSTSTSTPTPTSGNFWMKSSSKKTPAVPITPPPIKKSFEEEFSSITTSIPTESLMDDDFLNQMSFSKRGSVMFGGKKAVAGHLRPNGGRRQPSFSMLVTPTIKVLPDEVEKESQKVRSMYEHGTNFDWREGSVSSSLDAQLQPNPIEHTPPTSSNHLSPNINALYQRPDSELSFRSKKREHERAGGIEDWEDVNGRDVDRYGFINMRRNSRPGTPEPRPPQRVSTILIVASETPRKKRFGRSLSTATSARTRYSRQPSKKVSTKSLNTQVSSNSKRSDGLAQFRAAANRLPGNKDRRWMEEAGDMLTLPPGLADIAEDEEGGKAVEGLKRKEWERAEKWRKMAKVRKTGKDGEGMEFEFDARSPKLIERTWKGIPDRWRSAAWHSFLTTSAKKRKDYVTDEVIKADFYKLQRQSSAEDVQIDIDVPRTINSHIMFRKRYRGGQRLLFRVLHALSLYFPDTGYVQGMASLAATLLCYYDEELAFVMLVRMWTLRGLSTLYEHGFPGLMAALDEFQQQWLKGREVTRKLDELMIEPTAYGTRWYLTLFNYSIPFPAQLRVWDVFMLLGDSDLSASPSKERPFAGGLDVIHATSAALIDGTREILLDSDFENAMKVLTSWIPVKDEELLMKVAKAEWKMHRKRKGKQ